MRGQWGLPCASSNLAIGTIAGVVLAALLSWTTASAHALLMGETAKDAPLKKLEKALKLYARGRSHKEVWKKTGWYCTTRARGSCRWETKKGCLRPGRLNLNSFRRADGVEKEKKVSKVFNATNCIWRQYPGLENSVRVYNGDCNGAYGWAAHNGRVCIDFDRLQRDREKRADKESVCKNNKRNCGDKVGKAAVLSVLLHEIQHQIQFIEKYPKSARQDCPYRKRRIEREAFHVQKRAEWSKRKRKTTPPSWNRPGLC